MTDLRRRRHPAVALALLTLLAMLPRAAPGAVLDSLNRLRARGCPAHPAATLPVRASARLDRAARALAAGVPLRTALERAGYHAVSSFSVQISGVGPAGEVEHTLAQQYCQQSTNPAFREFGSAQRAGAVWIMLAEPFTPPAPREAAAIARQVLELTNAARERPRRCGARAFPAAPALSADATLQDTALRYAQEMARYGYMEHRGRDGSTPAERLTRSGYRWRESGENLASGVMSAEAVVAGWLGSPEHCANLMERAFTQMGVAFAVNERDARGVYWAMELGRPL